MNLQDIAVRGEWRELVTPGLRDALGRLEAQGVEFFWTCGSSYIFNARRDDLLLASHDGSETPRQAISEVILGAMTARGTFPQQGPVLPGRTRSRGRPHATAGR